MTNKDYRCGLVAIVGRPNVGKSTLMNHLLGQKISITSRKPQTTRHRILGIQTDEQTQAVFIDTPGIHSNAKKTLNKYLNRAASDALFGVDVVVVVVEALTWTDEDQRVLELAKIQEKPILLVLNKVDQIAEKNQLLAWIEKVVPSDDVDEIIPLSALKGINLDRLMELVKPQLPLAPPMFPDDQITDRSSRFLASEIVREKLTRRLGNELPYAVSVEIESYTEEENLVRIHALIWVERKSQKLIVVGNKGSTLKAIGMDARKDIERLIGCKVFLRTWVKVKESWSDDARQLTQLGYDD